MLSAVSGIDANTVWLNVIGNNLANANTVGFKSSSTDFETQLYDVYQAGAKPINGFMGRNPQAVGLGTKVEDTNQDFSQGTLIQTGVSTDMAINGQGFFVVQNANGQQYLTRAGNFTLSPTANDLVTQDGYELMGWQASNGTINTAAPPTPITIPMGMKIIANPTTSLNFEGNLDSSLPGTTPTSVTVDTYDSLGNDHQLVFKFTNAGGNTWDWTATDPTGTLTLSGATGTITFNSSGAYVSSTGGPITFTPTGANPMSITPDFSAFTQYSTQTTAYLNSQDGYPAGALQSFSVDQNGNVTGNFSNGQTQVLGQVAVGMVANPQGLVPAGNNNWTFSENSGTVVMTPPNTGQAGAIVGGALENSNTDISTEMTNLIMAERGLQMNTELVTTDNAVLSDLATMKQTP